MYLYSHLVAALYLGQTLHLVYEQILMLLFFVAMTLEKIAKALFSIF